MRNYVMIFALTSLQSAPTSHAYGADTPKMFSSTLQIHCGTPLQVDERFAGHIEVEGAIESVSFDGTTFTWGNVGGALVSGGQLRAKIVARSGSIIVAPHELHVQSGVDLNDNLNRGASGLRLSVSGDSPLVYLFFSKQESAVYAKLGAEHLKLLCHSDPV